MSEAAKQATPERALPCPFCGSDDVVSNEWCIDSEEQADKFNADEFGEIWAFECNQCLGSAPLVTWNNRDPWRRPPDLPKQGSRVLMVYRMGAGEESMPIVSTVPDPALIETKSIVRWMEIPE